MVLFKESSKNFGGQERRLLREAFWLLEAGHGVRIATPPKGSCTSGREAPACPRTPFRCGGPRSV
jgi:hypothetical protein